MTRRRSLRTHFLGISTAWLSLVVTCYSSEAIRVDRVEPPNWWVGMKYNDIQLLLSGDGLHEVTAEFLDRRLSVTGVSPGLTSRHCFVDVSVPDDLPPGRYTLLVRRGDQSRQIEFPLYGRRGSLVEQQGFDASDVIYLITPDRFADGDPENNRAAGTLDEFDPSQPTMRHGGDLQGIIDHLGYLRDLGVTTLWLNPVLENRGVNSYHGYKTTDHYRIDPRFGSNATYRRFVAEAHRHGLKVIFDHVNNHIGLRHPWVSDPPAADWFNGSVDNHLRDKHYLLAITDPHADPAAERMLKTFWFVDKMPDLNLRNPRLARYRIQNTLWWIECSGLDGIREDTYPYADQSYLAEWARVIRQEYPRLNIVGEIWATKSSYIAHFQQRSILPRDFETNLPAVMDFPLMQAMRRFVAGEGKLQDVYAIYAQDFLFTDPDNLLVFLDNHDTPVGSLLLMGTHEECRSHLRFS